jgi:hypothetical protein
VSVAFCTVTPETVPCSSSVPGASDPLSFQSPILSVWPVLPLPVTLTEMAVTVAPAGAMNGTSSQRFRATIT